MLQGVIRGFLSRDQLGPSARWWAAQTWYLGLGAIALGIAHLIASLFTDSERLGFVLFAAVVAAVAIASHLKVVALERARDSRSLSAWELLLSDRCEVLRIGSAVALAALVAVGATGWSALGQ